jgi:hypothetical protein
MVNAAPKANNPVFFPVFFFSRIADNSDKVIMTKATERKVSLWL